MALIVSVSPLQLQAYSSHPAHQPTGSARGRAAAGGSEVTIYRPCDGNPGNSRTGICVTLGIDMGIEDGEKRKF